ncbi:hypothetical protein BOTBODRAFT_30708 [Botryobasidium botryosum FD-172 SS1]|uniref:FAD/NAD(P)-binding domain-containing protein n=1 Tax=Botryobasidium botryosum (strain FD-172 SS1) TaxID=930990 RepID=A0A067MMS7_BOTB1|nr:hypothetical protein BOTBODRAFT_30708 [Botryobasidium botryosum FD-172 SS1]
MAGTFDGIDLKTTAKDWLDHFVAALNSGDAKKAAALFLTEGYWRDLLSLSWNFRTLKGPEGVEQYLSQDAKIGGDAITNLELQGEATTMELTKELTFIQAAFSFETPIAHGQGVVRLNQDPTTKQWLALTFYTGIEELKGYPEHVGPLRPKNTQAEREDRKTWKTHRAESVAYENRDPEVLIIGGGQSGLTAAARLGQLDIDTLIIERNPRIGDNWRNRYDFLTLHDPVWFDHLPYMPFPETWPVFPSKDKLADWLELYATAMELNVWTSSNVQGQPKYDETKKTWTVTIARSDGTTRTLHPTHLIIATSMPGEAYVPEFKGSDKFKGPIVHSTKFKSGGDHTQKKVLIIGCGTSALDIAQDLYEHDAEVTIVQRSTTTVVSSAAILNIVMRGMYDGTGPPTDVADLFNFSLPFPVSKKVHSIVAPIARQHDAALLEGLEKAGFALDEGPDGAGLLPKYVTRGGGYYIDVGGANLIVEGKVKVKQGKEVDYFEEDGVVFEDGSKLEADVIVLATGYKGMKSTVANLLGEEVASRTPPIWDVNKEGETNGLWKSTGYPHLWFHAGNLSFCRFYSKRLALQIKAQQVGIWKV